MTETPAARHHRLRAIRICLRASDHADDPSYGRWALRMARRLTNKHSFTATRGRT